MQGTGSPFRKVQTGDPLVIPADMYNATIDAVLAHKNSAVTGTGHERDFRSSGIVKVKNMSGATVSKFGVLGIDSPIIAPADNLDEFKSRVKLKGVTPDIDLHLGKFVILLEPLENNGIGDAIASGVAICKVNMLAEGDEFADIADADTTRLESGTSGAAKILTVESGTGEKWAQVRIGAGGGGTGVDVTRVSSTTPDANGFYNGYLQEYNEATDTFSDGAAIKLRDLNP